MTHFLFFATCSVIFLIFIISLIDRGTLLWHKATYWTGVKTSALTYNANCDGLSPTNVMEEDYCDMTGGESSSEDTSEMDPNSGSVLGISAFALATLFAGYFIHNLLTKK